MSDESSRDGVERRSGNERKERGGNWRGPALAVGLALVTILVGMLIVSIMERRWEAVPRQVVVQPIAEGEVDPAVWGRVYPRQYDRWMLTGEGETRTMFGGSFQRDYLEVDPMQVILFAGYAFSREYTQARGHRHSREDVWETLRVRQEDNPQLVRADIPGTCWTCKSSNVKPIMDRIGVEEFYRTPFRELAEEITHPISCHDCHNGQTMNLRISRPGLREAFEAQKMDISRATHQQMRSLVCAQCHVEYYFRDSVYLTFPWEGGTDFEAIERYYENRPQFNDWVHAVSKTPLVKIQHPDYELYSTGIHAYRGVSCADCHMPYMTEGGVKFSDHHVQSPLLNIDRSCNVCHRWGEEEIRSRVESIQTKVFNAKLAAEEAIVKAHFDIAAAMQAGADDADLLTARSYVRKAHIRWDFISASNGMGIHSPQESMRLLAESVNLAQQSRLESARVLARHGIAGEVAYPDISGRDVARQIAIQFERDNPPQLLPQPPAPAP